MGPAVLMAEKAAMLLAFSLPARPEPGPQNLQAVGLAVLMAKAGLAVPASPPVRLPPFSAVLADIGDEQSLSASLSTFSGHLRRTQACHSWSRV